MLKITCNFTLLCFLYHRQPFNHKAKAVSLKDKCEESDLVEDPNYKYMVRTAQLLKMTEREVRTMLNKPEGDISLDWVDGHITRR